MTYKKYRCLKTQFCISQDNEYNFLNDDFCHSKRNKDIVYCTFAFHFYVIFIIYFLLKK